MELDGHVVGIVGGIEFRNVEQTLSSQTVAKIARKQSRIAIDRELLAVAIFI